MAIAITLQQFLEKNEIDYDTVEHRPTATASDSAQAAHVPGSHLAKGVVLKDGDGYLLAVLPASHHIQMDDLKGLLSRDLNLASEEETEALFTDCHIGAIPAAGMAYGLDVVIDDSLMNTDDLYFEGGDHTTLVHMGGQAFNRMMGDAPYGRFSRHD